VKLLDFGIAKLGAIQGEATPQTRASVILGTPDYISPEQARGRPISPQTDLYAVGCVLFEMVTGQRLFKGENTLATMWSHVEDAPPVPSSLRPDIPQALDEIILWSLEKNSASRPPSAEAMREALAQVRLSLGPGAAMTPSPTTGSGERPIGAPTPPPSVRARVLAGTPSPSSPGQRVLGTPPPSRSGSQSSVSGRRPVTRGPVPASPETRMAPLTAVTVPEPVGGDAFRTAPTAVRPAVDDAPAAANAPNLDPSIVPTNPEREAYAPQRSKLPLVLAALIGVLLLGVAALLVIPSGDAEVIAEAPPTPKPVEPPKPVPPKVDPEPVDPTPVVVAPDREPDVKPEPPKPDVKPDVPPVAVNDPPKEPVKDPKPVVKNDSPKPKGPTTQQLQARLAKLEQKLAAREAERGEKDRVLRQIFDQARKDIASATTDAQRRAASQQLDEIQRQF
jgi:serine/threonine-protein kinase